MDESTKEPESLNQMNLSAYQQPLPNMPSYPYYNPEMQAINNYNQMHYFNNMQAYNGFPPQMRFYQEGQQFNVINSPEKQYTQINQLPPSIPQEKPNPKSYVNYLITTVTNLFNEGKITMNYLKEKTEHKSNGINNCSINSDYSSSSPSLKSLGSISKSNNSKNNYLNENTYSKNNYPKKNGNIIPEGSQCENPLCKYVFSSNKEKIKVKIKGLKSQEKKLCKKCCDAVEKGQFCYYCNSIYREEITDTAKWVECDFCKKWEHFDCELSKGKRYTSIQELTDVKQYMCPICVNKKIEQRDNEKKIQKKLINKKRRGDIFEDQKSKKNQRKDLRNLKSEKCSELLEDVELIESFKNCK